MAETTANIVCPHCSSNLAIGEKALGEGEIVCGLCRGILMVSRAAMGGAILVFGFPLRRYKDGIFIKGMPILEEVR